MKTTLLLSAILGASLLCATAAASAGDKERDALLQKFYKTKEKQAHELETQLGLKLAPEIWEYFRTADHADWHASTNLLEKLSKRAGQYQGSSRDPAISNPVWQTLVETDCACDFFLGVPFPLMRQYGRDVMGHIKPGSIYFGGTDPGRGVITALCEDHAAGKPFFTITQNALADANYITYLHALYGGKLKVPATEDLQQAFEDYVKDAQARLDKGQLKPGEDVKVVNGQVQVSGQISVMAINALIVKTIFDRNPDREYYVEESFPLEWMYPHLVPQDAIFRINRESLDTLPPEAVLQDHAFWLKRTRELVGDWFKEDTSVAEICTKVETMYQDHGNSTPKGFKGNPDFLRSAAAQKVYGKLRSATGGLYTWRVNAATSAKNRTAMLREADYALRQAFALCPYSPEALFRYSNLLVSQSRTADAIRLTETALKYDPTNTSMLDLLKNLKQGAK